MKSNFNVCLLFFVLGFVLTSCNNEETVTDNLCDIEISAEPVCSFNPEFSPEVNFPVFVLSDGVMVSSDDYNFLWSADPEFGGSAISVSYNQLPLTVTVTEIASGCTVEATLDQSYW